MNKTTAYQQREKPKYYVNARTVYGCGGKDLAFGIPDITGSTVSSFLRNDTVDDYVSEIILDLTNGEQCMLRISQEKD